MKNSILFFSDCPFFAGCENMLVNFFHSEDIKKMYDIAFVYRWSRHYEAGFRRRTISDISATPLHLYDHFEIYQKIDKRFPQGFRKTLKILVNLFLIKYVFLLANTYILFRTIRHRRVDLIHINSGGYPGAYSSYAMLFAASLCGHKKVVFVVNNIAGGYTSAERCSDFFIDRFVIRNLSVVFVTGSQYARGELGKVLKLSDSRIHSIHNGISPRPVTESRIEVLDRLKLPNDRLIIAIVAVLEERKGHIILLQALKELRDLHPDQPLPLCIIEGSGSTEDVLKMYVRENNLIHDVRFLTHEQHIFNLINAADCVILPSISSEDFPNIILEAMSLGKPVIASRFSGIPEQIEDGVSGILVEPRNVSELAEAVHRMAGDPVMRKEMATCARKRFQELFTDKNSIKNYLKLYHQILEAA